MTNEENIDPRQPAKLVGDYRLVCNNQLINDVKGITGDGKISDHPIVDTQISSLDRTLRELRYNIIEGTNFILDGLVELKRAVNNEQVPYSTSYTDRMIKLERLLIRYGELSEIARSIKHGIKLEQDEKKRERDRKKVYDAQDLLRDGR